jgi:hypothetical protein
LIDEADSIIGSAIQFQEYLIPALAPPMHRIHDSGFVAKAIKGRVAIDRVDRLIVQTIPEACPSGMTMA